MEVVFAMSVVLLAAGAEGFARGLLRLKLPPKFRILTVGLTFSAPVLVVIIVAGYGGYPRRTVALAVGSTIANVGLVLALATLARPLIARGTELATTLPLLVAATLLALFLVRDNHLDQWEGGLLLAAAIGAGFILARSPNASTPPAHSSESASWVPVVLTLTGLGWMVGAAVLLVRSSMESDDVVDQLGLGGSAFLFAVTLPAISLRGIATAIVAARNDAGDLALQGVVCGSLINVLVGLGVLAVGQPIFLNNRAVMEVFPAAVIATLFLISIRINCLTTRRWEGAIQLVAYVGFVVWLLPKG